MTKFNIKNISEYRTLLENRSVAEIIRNRVSLRQTIDNYFNWLKDKYPTVASSLDNLLKQKEQDLNEAIDLQKERRIKILIFDTLEAEALRKEIREQSQQQLDKLFTQPMPLDFQKADKRAIKNLEINSPVFYDTSDVIFLVNGLIEEVFFGLIPHELEKELNQEPKVELSELPAEWNTKQDELLSAICANSIEKVRDLSNLEPVEKAINEKCQELIAIIQKVRVSNQKESNQGLLKKVQELTKSLTGKEEDLKNKNKQLVELGNLKKAKLEAIRRVNNSWHNATMIYRGDKEKVLGEYWDEELEKKDIPKEVVEEQGRLIKLIEDRVEVEKQNQTELEKEIQEKIKEVRNFNEGVISHEDPQGLLETLNKYRKEWGSSNEYATPAQHAALRKNRVALDKAIVDFSVAISRNGAGHEIKNKLGNFKSNELLAKEEQINFENTLRKLQTSKEINEFENNVIENISVAKWVRSELLEIVSNINKALQDDQSLDEEKYFELYTELARYRDSPRDSSSPLIQARAISYGRQITDYRRTLFALLVKARNPALNRLIEAKNEALKKVSEKQTLETAIKQKFEHYQDLINRASLRELRNRSHEIGFEREINQLLKTEQTAQIIDNPPPKGN